MATIKKVWTAQTWIVGDATPTWVTLSGVIESYSAAIDLATNGYSQIVFWPEVDFDATPTDDVEFKIYTSADGGTTFTNIALSPLTISKNLDPSNLEVVIENPPPTLRVGFVQTGSTDSHNVRCSYKAANWSSV